MRLFTFCLAIFTSIYVSAQQTYWQQQLRYDIKAELNDKDKSVLPSL